MVLRIKSFQSYNFFDNDKFKNLFNIKSITKYNVSEIIRIINNIIKLRSEMKLSEYKGM